MLKKITLRNFKSFRDSTFELAPLTLMVGANASGKSNFVDALRILKGRAFLLMLNEIISGKWRGGQEIWPPIRGGAHELINLFEKVLNFELEIKWELADSIEPLSGIYSLAVGLEGEVLTVFQERLAVDEEEYIGPRVPVDVNDISQLFHAKPLISNLPAKVDLASGLLKTWMEGFHFLDLVPSLNAGLRSPKSARNRHVW